MTHEAGKDMTMNTAMNTSERSPMAKSDTP